MEVSSGNLGSTRVLRVQGRLDHSHAKDFEAALAPHLVACTAAGTPLVLDFSDVVYISSVGLRVLLLAAKKVKAVVANEADLNGAATKNGSSAAKLLERMAELYATSLAKSEEALAYLRERGITDLSMMRAFRLMRASTSSRISPPTLSK